MLNNGKVRGSMARLQVAPDLHAAERHRATAPRAADDARPGPLGVTWRDWLLIGQVAAVALFVIWLGLAGYVTFDGLPPR